MKKFSFTKCGSSRYFSGSLAVFEERGEPACGRAANHEGFSSPPQAAKNVRTILSIRSQSGKVNDLGRLASLGDQIERDFGRKNQLAVLFLIKF